MNVTPFKKTELETLLTPKNSALIARRDDTGAFPDRR